MTAAPDAHVVDLAPPLDRNGNFKVSPKTNWRAVQGIAVKADTPRGNVTAFQMNSQDSKLFSGNGRPFTRDVWVYVPAGYKPGTALPLMVDHDGGASGSRSVVAGADGSFARLSVVETRGLSDSAARSGTSTERIATSPIASHATIDAESR